MGFTLKKGSEKGSQKGFEKPRFARSHHSWSDCRFKLIQSLNLRSLLLGENPLKSKDFRLSIELNLWKSRANAPKIGKMNCKMKRTRKCLKRKYRIKMKERKGGRVKILQ